MYKSKTLPLCDEILKRDKKHLKLSLSVKRGFGGVLTPMTTISRGKRDFLVMKILLQQACVNIH